MLTYLRFRAVSHWENTRDTRRAAVRWLTLAAAVAPLCSVSISQALLALSLTGLIVTRQRLRFPPIKLPLGLFIAGTLLALALSGHMAAGWPQVRKFYVFLLVPLTAASAFRRLEDGRRLVLWWVVGAAGSTAVGLAQFGARAVAARQTGDSFYHALVGQRITGFMSLWMTFAGELMIVLMMALALLIFAAEERRRHWRWMAPATAAIAVGLVLALTRGQWLGASAGLVYLVWRWRPKLLPVVPVAAAVLFLAAPATVRERVESIYAPHSKLDSNRHRIVLWQTGLEMIKAHPWFGLGPEQVDEQFLSYVPPEIARPLPWGWYGHLHNIYLQYAAERGIPVLLVFLWLVGKVVWDLWRAARRAEGLARALLDGVLATVVAVLVAGLFEHNLGDSEILQMFLTAITVGYLAMEQASDSQRAKSGKSGDRHRCPGARDAWDSGASPRFSQLEQGARVAVVRLRSLGDCVLTTPALEILKSWRPDLEIGVVVEGRFAGVFEGNPAVSAILPPEAGAVRRFRPVLCLNLHGGTRSMVLTALSGARYRAGFAHHRGAALYNLKIPRAQEILGVERTVHTAEHLASAMFWLGAPVGEVPQAQLFAEAAPAGPLYAVIHPVAAAAYKTWRADGFLAVARHLKEERGLEPVFIGAAGDELQAFAGFRVVQGAPLAELKALLARAALFVGNDSGPAHIACAFGVPVVVLFGRPEHQVIWAPWKAAAAKTLVSAEGIEKIGTEEVLGAIGEVLTFRGR